jgi:hypothetical protein
MVQDKTADKIMTSGALPVTPRGEARLFSGDRRAVSVEGVWGVGRGTPSGLERGTTLLHSMWSSGDVDCTKPYIFNVKNNVAKWQQITNKFRIITDFNRSINTGVDSAVLFACKYA